MKEHSIKQIVWGFQNIIYSLYPKISSQKKIAENIASLFNLTIENLLPFKYFVRCTDKDADTTIFIFDIEEDCVNWVNENRHLFVNCNKITFDEFDRCSDGSWRNWANYIDEFDCTDYIEEYDELMKSEYDDPLEFIPNYRNGYNMYDNDIENINIKQIIWGFCKIIDNLDSDIDEQLSIRTDVIGIFNPTIKKLMPTKFFACCIDMDYELELTDAQIFIFDCEEECDDWIEQWAHCYSSCEKITFEDFDRMFGSSWRDWSNYLSQQFSMELGQDWDDPLQLEVHCFDNFDGAYEENV